MKFNAKTLAGCTACGVLAAVTLVSCGKDGGAVGYSKTATTEEILKDASSKGKIGNWGLGNEYEVYALLNKYNLPTSYVSQAFDMDGFDTDNLLVASAMSYNEYGLVINDYAGAYGYGKENVGVIDMNKEGTAMLEDNIFCTRTFAKNNPNTVKAFIYASMKGWAYAVNHTEEAAQIVYEYGSSVSSDHQKFMASEVAKLVTKDSQGNTVADANLGKLDDTALGQTLTLAKTYISLDNAQAQTKMQALTLDDIRDKSYYEAAMASNGTFGTLEKSSVSIQLKWLPQAQFMGYYVALKKGYYSEVGLTVNVISGGGDIGETTGVNQGTVDFGVTWSSNIITCNAGGMDLINVCQVYQSSGMYLIYKYND